MGGKQRLNYRGFPDNVIGTYQYPQERDLPGYIIPVKQQNNFKLLILIMALTSLIVGAISIVSLYNTAIEQHRLRVVETVKSQARLIEAIASYQAFDTSNPGGSDWEKTTLQQIKNAYDQFDGFGETGEFALARLSDANIEFVLRHRYTDNHYPMTIPFAGNWAEPMRLALTNQSGIIIGLDYRGQPVLAAYEPIKLLNLGLVAKIDLAEIRAPFIRTGIISLIVGLLIIFIASRLFFRIATPIQQQIEQQAETFRTLAETAREGIILIDTHGTIEYANPSAEIMFCYARGSLIGTSVNRLMPASMGRQHNQFIKNYLASGIGKIIGTGRQLTGHRKDGSQFPMHLSIGDINLKHTRLFAGVIMDISEQQQLQREIMEVPVREQRRIGQELHDGIGQQLTGLGMLATSLLNKATKPEHSLAAQLADGLQEALSQVRALSRGLVPIEIDADSFISALKNLTEEIQRQSHIPVKFEIINTINFTSNDMVIHLYRIAQEALNNAIKHANCRSIYVSIEIEDDDGLLEIYDNGRGIPIDFETEDGLGLNIMKYRSSLFDGQIRVYPVESGGTRVCCRFPLKQAEISN